MSKVNIPFIPHDVTISLEVSGTFYKKLQALLIHLGEQKSPEEFKKVLDKMKTDEPPADAYEAMVHVMAALVVSTEKAALAQNKIQYKEHDFTTPTE